MTLPTCANGFVAAIKGLLGAVGLSDTAPSVWALPCSGLGFRPARSGTVFVPCSINALLTTPLGSCSTQGRTLCNLTCLCYIEQQENLAI
ncbi:MAG: hypothetical protein FRX49_04813 [Trebouxia sp. A1-2]|nr:MAG: hypothetical protein FRX49_04813 [Trebouxia sp. A1-2]